MVKRMQQSDVLALKNEMLSLLIQHARASSRELKIEKRKVDVDAKSSMEEMRANLSRAQKMTRTTIRQVEQHATKHILVVCNLVIIHLSLVLPFTCSFIGEEQEIRKCHEDKTQS